MKMYCLKKITQSQLYNKLKICLTLIILCLISTSCVKQINLYHADEEDKEDEKNTPDLVERVEDLKFESLALSPDNNEFIYGDVEFQPNADKTRWTATIKNYQADLSQLKVTFKVVQIMGKVGERIV